MSDKWFVEFIRWIMECEGGVHCINADEEEMAAAFDLNRRKMYSEDKADRGGATLCGVTLTTYRQHRPHATSTDLRNIPFGEWKEILWTDYWKAMRCTHIWPSIALSLADFGFNSGPARAVRYLQITLNNVVPTCSLTVDGKIGFLTCRAIAALDARQQLAVVESYNERRRVFIRRSVTAGGIHRKYLAGLLNRTKRVSCLSKKFIG